MESQPPVAVPGGRGRAWLQRAASRRRLLALGGSGGAAALLAACGGRGGGTGAPTQPSPGATATQMQATPAIARPAGWTEESHGSGVPPNYAVVFPRDRVNKLTFIVPAGTWEAMLANMTELFGPRGGGGSGGFGQPGGGPPRDGFVPRGQPDAADPGGPPPVRGGFETPNPDWFKATVQFNGRTWTNVGLRFKGNSSLRSAWSAGTDSMPFKLDFDEFEDEHPEIEDQRFYGFKQLSLANNFGDESGMRETVAYGLLDEAGLVAARTAFCEVFLDRGEGPASLGLYTMVEVVDDTVIDRAFADPTGTTWEADGPAASLSADTSDLIPASFQVEAGEETWGPIEMLHRVLHSDERTADPDGWRARLESVFDVETFLRWLGLSTAMLHWDTYGQMTHNYYLYDNPATGQLTWISWDHNLVLGSRGGPGRFGLSFDHAGIDARWPLIRFLLDDTAFRERYHVLLRETAESVFVVEELLAEYGRLGAILEPHVPEAERETFRSALRALESTTRARGEALAAYLATIG